MALGASAGAQPAGGPGAPPADTPGQPASDANAGQPPAPGAPRVATATFTLSGSHAFSTSLSDAPGSFSVDRGSATLAVNVPAREEDMVTLTLTGEVASFNFDGATAFFPGVDQPWDGVFSLDAGVRYAGKATRQLRYFASLFVASDAESGADFEDSITFGGTAGVAYYLSESFSISLAARVRTQLEDDVFAIPLPGFDWQIDKEWNLYTSFRGGGPNVILDYAPSDAWTYSLGVGYRTMDFRLDDTGAAPGGVGGERRVPIFLGVVHRPHAQIELGAQVGVVAWHELKLEDAAGNTISRADADPSFFVGLSAMFKF